MLISDTGGVVLQYTLRDEFPTYENGLGMCDLEPFWI